MYVYTPEYLEQRAKMWSLLTSIRNLRAYLKNQCLNLETGDPLKPILETQIQLNDQMAEIIENQWFTVNPAAQMTQGLDYIKRTYGTSTPSVPE